MSCMPKFVDSCFYMMMFLLSLIPSLLDDDEDDNEADDEHGTAPPPLFPPLNNEPPLAELDNASPPHPSNAVPVITVIVILVGRFLSNRINTIFKGTSL